MKTLGYLGWAVALLMTIACIQIHKQGASLIEKSTESTEKALIVAEAYKSAASTANALAREESTSAKRWEGTARGCLQDYRLAVTDYISAVGDYKTLSAELRR